MEDSTRISLGIVLGALLLLFGFIAYHEYERQRDIDDAQAVMQGLSDYAQQALQEGQRQSALDRQRYEEQQRRSLEMRQLGPQEQCVAGTVVVVTGSSYTQEIGAGARPVACSGRYRL